MAQGGGQFFDQARILRTQTGKSGPRKEGGYKKTKDEPGPWFRCAYDPGDESEVRTQGGVRRRREATITCGVRAKDGSTIEFQANDAVEVDSKLHGTLRLDVIGTPTPLGKRKGRGGYVVRVGKVKRKAPG